MEKEKTRCTNNILLEWSRTDSSFHLFALLCVNKNFNLHRHSTLSRQFSFNSPVSISVEIKFFFFHKRFNLHHTRNYFNLGSINYQISIKK